MNESTTKITNAFLAQPPDEQAKSLALLLEFAETAEEPEKRRHFRAMHDTLKNLIEPQNGGQQK